MLEQLLGMAGIENMPVYVGYAATVVEGALMLVGGASLICKVIPGEKDDEVVGKIGMVVQKISNFLSLIALNPKK